MFRRILDAVSLTPATGKAAVIGVDWGRVNDYTVFAVLSDAGELLELDRFRGIEYALQRARLQALYERQGKPLILAEANSIGGPVIEQLARDGLKVKAFMTTNASKTEAVEALALAFERGEIRIPNDPALIGELQAFEAKPLPSGLMRYDAPSGGHDDTVMALAIAWQGVAGKRRRAFDPEFMRQITSINAGLTKPASGQGDGGAMDRLPSEYPMGGSGGSNRWRGCEFMKSKRRIRNAATKRTRRDAGSRPIITDLTNKADAYETEIRELTREREGLIPFDAELGTTGAAKRLKELDDKIAARRHDAAQKREAIQQAETRLADARQTEAADAERARQKELGGLASVAMRHAEEFSANLRQAASAGAALKLVVQNMTARATPGERQHLNRLMETGPYMRCAEHAGLRAHVESSRRIQVDAKTSSRWRRSSAYYLGPWITANGTEE